MESNKKRPAARKRVNKDDIIIEKTKLNGNESRFCELVASGKEPDEAYKEAYGRVSSDNYAKKRGREMMRRPEIVSKVDDIKKELQDKRLFGEEDDEKLNEEIMWSQGIAFNRLKRLLDGCDSATQLLEDRPRLFSEVRQSIADIRQIVLNNGLTSKNTAGLDELMDCMENIEDIVYKLSKFNIKEYNSTIYTATALMKEINNLTGVKKNTQTLKTESLEDKIYGLIADSSRRGNSNDIMKGIEEYAFSE